MRWGFLVQVVLGIALVTGAIVLGTSIYQAGFAAGVATEGNVALAPAYGYGFGWHGGFGFFGFLGLLLFLFLLIGLIRAIAWGGRGGWGRRGWGPGYGPRGPGHEHRGFGGWEGPARDAFDDWHRRAHDGPDGSNDRTSTDPPAPR